MSVGWAGTGILWPSVGAAVHISNNCGEVVTVDHKTVSSFEVFGTIIIFRAATFVGPSTSGIRISRMGIHVNGQIEGMINSFAGSVAYLLYLYFVKQWYS